MVNMRRALIALPLVLVFGTAMIVAQAPPNALLSPAETQAATSRATQLMETTAAAVPGLVRASEPLRQNAQATAAALAKTLRDTSLTLRFTREISAYLALADSLPRPDVFQPASSQQFLELRDILQKFNRHFEALLVKEQADVHAVAADPYELNHYAAVNSKTLPPIASQPRYVFLGDSGTERWPLNEYFAGQDFVNRGIAGQTTHQILARFLADVVALRPLAVVVLAGSNDVAAGMTPSAIADNLVMMGDVARAHSVQPMFASLLPVSGSATKVRTPEAIQKVNTWIREYCIRENFIYIDYYAAMADAKGMMKAEYTDDGVNPNSRGYRVMAPILLDGVERLRIMLASPEDVTKIRRRLPLLIAK
jgi:lysophospholipase L1-like esterase